MARASLERRRQALVAVGTSWREPSHEAREKAVEDTLRQSDWLTAEALAFTLNQRMHQLSNKGLKRWSGRLPHTSAPGIVAILSSDDIPLADWFAVVAALLSGHSVRYGIAKSHRPLMSSLAKALNSHLGERLLDVTTEEEAIDTADALIAPHHPEADRLVETATERGIPSTRQYVGAPASSVAVLDASADDDVFERLAEDAFLFDGRGRATPRLLFAPEGMAPDAFLDACARFRSIHPAHQSMAGRLTMQQAMLDATDTPHGYGEDLGFLVSKGGPEVQPSGHLRWVPYADRNALLQQIPEQLHLLIAMPEMADALPRKQVPTATVQPGEAHRPPVQGYFNQESLVNILAAVADSSLRR